MQSFDPAIRFAPNNLDYRMQYGDSPRNRGGQRQRVPDAKWRRILISPRLQDRRALVGTGLP